MDCERNLILPRGVCIVQSCLLTKLSTIVMTSDSIFEIITLSSPLLIFVEGFMLFLFMTNVRVVLCCYFRINGESNNMTFFERLNEAIKTKIKQKPKKENEE
jgi:hypothetical protein